MIFAIKYQSVGEAGHMVVKMQWDKLMNTDRLGVGRSSEKGSLGGNRFSDDKDRVLFSKEARLLQGKTQVFSLPSAGEYVRNRFSHSLEVSSVGRRIGNIIKCALHDKYPEMRGKQKYDFASLIETACLCHDIGHPPLAHVGEDAIRLWFKTSPLADGVFKKMKEDGQGDRVYDFLRFEGNAQNFRLLSRLMKRHKPGGLQLTLATLATVAKYPCSADYSRLAIYNQQVAFKKHGFFMDDAELFSKVAEGTGLLREGDNELGWRRHPLSYIVEAADDICYSIIDIEDAVSMGCVTFENAVNQIIGISGQESLPTYHGGVSNQTKLEEIREEAIRVLIKEVADVFLKNEDVLLSGEFCGDLISQSRYANEILSLKRFAQKHIYVSMPALSIRTSGYAMLEGLMTAFVEAVEDKSENGEQCSSKSEMIVTLAATLTEGKGMCSCDPYQRLLSITDMISGLSDEKAIEVYKIISGQSLTSL